MDRCRALDLTQFELINLDIQGVDLGLRPNSLRPAQETLLLGRYFAAFIKPNEQDEFSDASQNAFEKLKETEPDMPIFTLSPILETLRRQEQIPYSMLIDRQWQGILI